MKSPLAASALLFLLSTGAAFAQNPTCPGGTLPCQGGPLPVPLPLFPRTNWWNLDISNAPVDGSSGSILSFINNGGNRKLHPDFGGLSVDDPPPAVYGFPYVVVSGSQAKKTVQFDFSDESDGVDHNTDTSFPFYPIPDQLITAAHWIEGGQPGNQDLRDDADRHILIVDKDNNHLYELYNVYFDGATWFAGSGAFFDMNTNNRRPETWTSADASGIQILPGLVRYDEANTAAPIDHAFRVTVRDTRQHVYPASHTACRADPCNASAPPMGTRLRLKPGTNISGYPARMQRIFQAMKTYGLIVVDNGSDMYISGTFDERWDGDEINDAFGDLHANDFEVIQLGYNPTPDLAITLTDGVTSATPGGTTTYTIVVTNNGPTPVGNALVTDTFPTAAVSAVSWTCAASSGSSCATASGTGNINHKVSLLSGGTATFTAVVTIKPTPPATLVNTASVSGVTVIDPVAGNNSATDTDTLLPPADLQITKTDNVSSVTPSSPVSYTIVASNAGPSAVTGATVSDTVPASLLGAAWTCAGAGGGTCPAPSGTGNISQAVNLPSGGSVTYTLSGTLSANPSSLSNTATIAVPAANADPNLANNSATDTDVLICAVETTLVPDGRALSSSMPSGATGSFLVNLHPGSSYSIELRAASGQTSGFSTTVFRGDDGCSGSSTAATHDTATADPRVGAGTRVTLTASGDPNYRVKVANTSGQLLIFTLTAAETTLYSPAFSTNSTFNTYYAMQNTTSQPINAVLTLRSAAGVVLGPFPLAVPAGRTTTANTQALSLPRGLTGTAQLSYDGPPGGLIATAAIANFSSTPAYVQSVKFEPLREAR